ncbi:tetratricopeptide repeat protein [Actinomadura macrotermitis]|uniref:tetratricopeptide repeat protein n=1 Tax=Actinomadura macrotermitis TaxID=2585200 RepID=UPI001A9AD9A2|nr:tetratricopeptide repeat protein [Actinomadura macrotermitis]
MAQIDPAQIRTRQELVEQLGLLFVRDGWSHHRLAEAADGLSPATVRKAVSDVTALPRPSTLKALAKAFGRDAGPWLEARDRIQRLEKNSSAPEGTGSAPRVQVGVVPRAADCFQRREAASKLEKMAAGGGTVVLCQVLAGMGGVGKTQLAAAYAREQQVDVLVWVTASSTVEIVAAYADAATALGLPAVPGDQKQEARRFLEWAATTDDRWLIVLDDVQEPGDLRGWWPPDSGNGRVVVTTRRRDAVLSGQGRRLIDVELFTPDEARAYLTAKLAVHGLDDDSAQVDGLAEDVGWLPLALAQAAAYMVDAGLDCAGYRARLADRRRELPDVLPEPGCLPDDHQAVVAAAWSLSIERADRARPAGLARPLLWLCSMLDPNGIPAVVLTSEAALTYLAEHRPSEQEVESDLVWDALRVLHRFSLIDHTPEAFAQEVRVHNLVQRATRESLTPEQRAATVQAAADALLEVWPEVERGQLAPILRANTMPLRHAAGSLLWQGEMHGVLFCAVESLGAAGQPSGAATECIELLTICDQLLGSAHSDTLDIRHNLAYWRGEAGDPAGATDAFQGLLTDRLRILGPDHPDTLTTRGNLARWRGEAGDPAGAADALQELLTDRLRILGPDHPDTLATRSNLAYWRGGSGDPAGAADALQELLTDHLRILGPDHPDTLATRHNLAYWRGGSGDPAGAADAFQELLTDHLRILGPDHPDTLTTRSNLARWRGEAGDPAGAADAFQELLTDRLRILGPDHPHTLTTRSNLAYWRGGSGDPAGAADAFQELLTDRLRILGPDHPDTLTTRNNLAYWRGYAGDPAVAVEAFAELLVDCQRVLGSEHPLISSVQDNLSYWRKQADPS